MLLKTDTEQLVMERRSGATIYDLLPPELNENIIYLLPFDRANKICSLSKNVKCDDSSFWKRVALVRFGIPIDEYEKYYHLFVGKVRMTTPEKYLWNVRKIMMYEYLLESVPEDLDEIQHDFELYGGYDTHQEYADALLDFIANLDDDNLKNLEFARDVIVPEVTILDEEDMIEEKVNRVAVIFLPNDLNEYKIFLLSRNEDRDVGYQPKVLVQEGENYPQTSLPRLYLKTIKLSNSVNSFEFNRRYIRDDEKALGYSSKQKFHGAQAKYLRTASEEEKDKIKMIIQIMNKLVNSNIQLFSEYDGGFSAHGVLISKASEDIGLPTMTFKVPHLVIYNQR